MNTYSPTETELVSTRKGMTVSELTKMYGCALARHTTYELKTSERDEGTGHYLIFNPPLDPDTTGRITEEDLIKILLHRLSSPKFDSENIHLMKAKIGLSEALSDLRHFHSESRGVLTESASVADE